MIENPHLPADITDDDPAMERPKIQLDLLRALDEMVRLKPLQRKQIRNRRLYRRLTQFNIVCLLLLMTVAGILCVIGPTVANRVHTRINQSIANYQMRQEDIADMKRRRPGADAYAVCFGKRSAP